MLIKLQQEEIKLWKKGRHITLDALKNAMDDRQNQGDFMVFMQREIQNSSLKPRTQKNHLTTYKALSQFRKRITFADIDYVFLKSFEEFLYSRHYHVNTIAKHMKQLKRYVNQAINKDFIEIQNNAFSEGWL